ncbi:hypothetical protein [Sorangium sp. So ce1389]|uniref:hypothetical protein n=1 Tax=Sorangium sp. So ce1389 TaxID=3133336 RepID=UPI003F6089B0
MSSTVIIVATSGGMPVSTTCAPIRRVARTARTIMREGRAHVHGKRSRVDDPIVFKPEYLGRRHDLASLHDASLAGRRRLCSTAIAHGSEPAGASRHLR